MESAPKPERTFQSTSGDIAATAAAAAAYSGAGCELWKIIQNGKSFLAALEEFAKINYPNNNHEHDNNNNNNNNINERNEKEDIEQEEIEKEEKEKDKEILTINKHEETPSNEEKSPPRILTVNDAYNGDKNDNYNNDITSDKNEENTFDNNNNEEDTSDNHDEDTSSSASIIIPYDDDDSKDDNREIIQYCGETGKELGRFPTIMTVSSRLAATYPGLSPWKFRNGILNVLYKKTPRFLNYSFRFADDDDDDENNDNDNNNDDLATSTTTIPATTATTIPTSNVSTQLTLTTTTNKDKKRGLEEQGDSFNDNTTTGTTAAAAAAATATATATTTTLETKRPKKRRIPRAVIQYSSITGEEENRYETVADAARILAPSFPDISSLIDLETRIRETLSGNMKPCGFHYFRYSNDTTSPMPIRFPMSDDPSKNIPPLATGTGTATAATTDGNSSSSGRSGGHGRGRVCRSIDVYCSKSGKLIGTFKNVTVIVQILTLRYPHLQQAENSFSGHTIKGHLNGKIKTRLTYHGFYFRYSNDDTSPMPEFPIPE